MRNEDQVHVGQADVDLDRNVPAAGVQPAGSTSANAPVGGEQDASCYGLGNAGCNHPVYGHPLWKALSLGPPTTPFQVRPDHLGYMGMNPLTG